MAIGFLRSLLLFLLLGSLHAANAVGVVAEPLFTPEEFAYLKQKKEITMCIDPDWMPFEKIENGRHIGMTAEYFELFEEKIGIPIVMVPTKTWSESIEFAKARKCDIFSLAMETKERKEYMNFTKPYLEAPLVITTRIHTIFISDPKDIIEYPLGITKGYAFIEILNEKYPGINLVEYETLDQGLEAVRKNEIFGYVDNLMTSGYKIQQKYFGELKIAGKFDDRWELGIGVRNDDLMLLQIFEKAIDLVKDEEYNRIINKWISIRYEQGFDYELFWKILLLFGVVIFFGAYRHFVLNKYVTELKNRDNELKRLTIIDDLSGLYNRRHFNEIFLSEFDRAKRTQKQFVFALLDIDHFKRYNDSYGHQAGDEVIKEIGEVLKHYTQRSGDYAFRVGGEEFAIILQSCTSEECSDYFEKVREMVEMLKIAHLENPPSGCITLSIGVVRVTHYDNLTTDAIYKFTDDLLYKAKKEGRNRVEKGEL